MSENDKELAKDLGPLAALTIGVGTMIGAGIFVLPGAAIQEAGVMAIASFVLGGGIALLTAFSASELGTAMPRSGGAYFYVNRALGPLFGSIAGWANWLGLAFASAFYMVGFGEYIVAIVGEQVTLAGFGVTLTFPVSVQVVALAGGAFFVFVNYVGAKETGKLQNIIVVVLIAILMVFTAVGALRANPANLPPAAGFGPALTTTGIIFVSYLGFVQITSVAEEIKEPGRNLPRAIIGSVVIVTSIYALVLITMAAAVEEGFIAQQEMAGNIAVVEVAARLLGPVGAVAMLAGGLLATASSANASILASSRINFAMGRDEILSPEINRVHPRFGTPYRAIAVTGALILLFILFGEVKQLASLGSFLHLVIYGLLNVALIVMREAEVSEYEPEYTVPLYPAVPILGTVLSFALIAYISPTVRLLGFGLVGAAVLWYVLYARSRTSAEGVLSEHILDREDGLPDSVVSAATTVQPDGGQYRVMVPLSNPKTETDLVTLAAAAARQRGGTVDAVHVITVPDQTSLQYAKDHLEEFEEDYHEVLDQAQADAETFGVEIDTHTVVSHRGYEEIFDAARSHKADLVVIGWDPEIRDSGRLESRVSELRSELPCDFLALRDHGFDPEHVLLPTAGGPESDLSAELASVLRSEHDAEITLLHVTDDEDRGVAFLDDWAREHGLTDVNLRVETGDTEAAIERAAADCSMVILGATERGLVSRLVDDSTVDVASELDCSVVLAERPTDRSLRDRLIG